MRPRSDDRGNKLFERAGGYQWTASMRPRSDDRGNGAASKPSRWNTLQTAMRAPASELLRQERVQYNVTCQLLALSILSCLRAEIGFFASPNLSRANCGPTNHDTASHHRVTNTG